MDNLKTWPEIIHLSSGIDAENPDEFSELIFTNTYIGNKNYGNEVEYIRADLVPKMVELSDEKILRLAIEFGISTDRDSDPSDNDVIGFALFVRGEK